MFSEVDLQVDSHAGQLGDRPKEKRQTNIPLLDQVLGFPYESGRLAGRRKETK
jgi:hypothetical protein